MPRFAQRLTGFVIACGLLLAAGELLLQMLPILSGVHRAAPTPDWPHARLLPNNNLTYSQGWDLREIAHNRTNSAGFVAPYDYKRDVPSVALIGDSFAEGLSLPFDKSLTAALNRNLGQSSKVYNFGMSGASLAHHLGVAQSVGKQYTLESAVIVISPNDYVESNYKDPGIFHWAASIDQLIELEPVVVRTGWMLLVRELGWLRYGRFHLKASLTRMFGGTTSEAFEASRCEAASDTDRQRIDAWLARLPGSLRLEPAKVVLLFDSDRDALYRSIDRPLSKASTCQPIDDQMRAYLKEQAGRHGYRVIDAAPVYERDYRAHRSQLDYSPMDRHWNPRAVDLLAKAIAEGLKQP